MQSALKENSKLLEYFIGTFLKQVSKVFLCHNTLDVTVNDTMKCDRNILHNISAINEIIFTEKMCRVLRVYFFKCWHTCAAYVYC